MFTSLPQNVQKVCLKIARQTTQKCLCNSRFNTALKVVGFKCHHITDKSPQDRNNKVPSLFCVLEFGFSPEGPIRFLRDADYQDLT